ncbi:MAG: hypothetical protein KJO07_19075, partial [Deltaproteobacteria bacterium]|nr:hypothetical protein [Deltaproteobacteria bacterium]
MLGRLTGRLSAAHLLFGALLLSLAYFYQAGGWNQNSRYDLVRALAERGTVRIDSYHRNTGDKARLGGHFFSDKAPGQSFAVLPVALAVRTVGGDMGSPRGAKRASYAMTVFGSALPCAAMLFALLALARRHGRTDSAAFYAALVLCLGTPMWAYGTLLMGHALSAAALVGALACAEALSRAGSRRRDFLLGTATGLLAGWAVMTEYPAAVPALLLSGYLVWSIRAQMRARGPVVLSGLVAGACVCGGLLASYHVAAFGSPLATPLDHLYLFKKVREQPFDMPSASALYAIFLGGKRGLLPLAPVLAVSLYGLVLMIRDRQSRALGVLCALMILYYALFNAAFATPMAGWSYGPRYMAAALPFWALPLAWVWHRHRDKLRRA